MRVYEELALPIVRKGLEAMGYKESPVSRGRSNNKPRRDDMKRLWDSIVREQLTPEEKAIKILNAYRNFYYTEGYDNEHGIIAQAINVLLPKFAKQMTHERMMALAKKVEGRVADINNYDSEDLTPPWDDDLDSKYTDYICEVIKYAATLAAEMIMDEWRETDGQRDS